MTARIVLDAAAFDVLDQPAGAELRAQRGSEHIADAHVVAVCADAEQAIVITADPDDIAALAVAVPGVRIVTRKP